MTIDTQALWTDYGSSLQSFLRSKVANPEDAEDLLQDILIKTHTSLHTVKEDTRVKPWLMQVANRAIIDFYRKGKRKNEPLSEEGIWWDEHEVERERGLAECLRPLIDALPDDSAQLLEAVDIEGRSQKELAKSLGVSYSAVKSRVQRARRELRGIINRCCHISIDSRGKVIDFERRSKKNPCERC